MPLCTTCTTSVPFLYTVYASSHNLRLEQCVSCRQLIPPQERCHAFADPYVEHDSLTILLDLILLKRGVYRHLLYNRGAEPRRAVAGTPELVPPKTAKEKEKIRWLTILRFGGPLICVDSFIRWSHLNPNHPVDISPWTKETMQALFRTFVGVFVETLAFHAGVICACSVVLGIADWFGAKRPMSNIRREFRFSLIPLTLFYSSLTKLFLLFLLTIWRPSPPSSDNASWDFDREWVVRNVLGGMSAGFGLRVILDSHPFFTMSIIIFGWVVKTAVSMLVSQWVGGDEQMGEAWLAYSIP